MAKTPTPIEVMAKAHHEAARADSGSWLPAWEAMGLGYREHKIKATRAALRALAEMEPTEKMVEEAVRGVRLLDADENGQGSYASAAEHALRWGILAAANEGEQPPEQAE